jgi:hypothetical protein
MNQKPLSEMTFGELSEELTAATASRQIAEYQDGLANWTTAVNAAQAWLNGVNAEIEQKHGG